MKLQRILGFWTVVVFGLGAQVQADVVNHGNFITSTSHFNAVTEITDGASLFYGSPQTTGDSGLFFSSSLADGSDVTSSTGQFNFVQAALTTRIEAAPGQLINGIRVRQFGSVSTLGANSFARAASSGFVTVGTDVFFGSTSTLVTGDNLGGSFEQSFEVYFPQTDSLILSLQDGLFTFADVSFGFSSVNTQGVVLETFSVTSIPEPHLLLVFGVSACCLAIRKRTR